MRPHPARYRPALSWAAASLLACGTAAANVALALNGAGPYYSVEVPLELQWRSRAASLGDLQVHNARGEALAFAWIDLHLPAAQQRRQAMSVFKLPGAASGATVGPQRSWLLDASGVAGSLLAVELALPANARGVYSVSVEASADLQQWRMVRPSAQVVSLAHQGQRLLDTRIDLDGPAVRYLRLTALPGSLLLPLQAASLLITEERRAAPRTMQWSEAIAPSACEARHYTYLLPPHLPVELAQLELSEPGTAASVSFLGQLATPTPAQRKHRGLRERVKSLRHKDSPPRTQDDSGPIWWTLASANVYRLTRPEGELKSGPVRLTGGAYPALRVQTTGPISQLGATPPNLRVGAQTRSLVFLARGPQPYRLVLGAPQTLPSALTLSQLMPDRKAADPLPSDTAVPVRAAPIAAPAVQAVPMPTTSRAAPNAPAGTSVWLWAALLVGLGLMAGMAWLLLRRPAPESAKAA